MARKNHIKSKTLPKQIEDKLKSMFVPGQSKHMDKQFNSMMEEQTGRSFTSDYIYSYSTFKTYMKHLNYFTNYCKENHNCKTLDDCKAYIVEWLHTRDNLSPYTIKLEISSLCKLYGMNYDDFKTLGYEPPIRQRTKITRSRHECVRDSHFSEKSHLEIVTFCKCFGLRRNELYSLKKDDLKQNPDGSYYIHVHSGSKGGRVRKALFMGSQDELKIILDYFSSCDEKPFSHVPNGMDVHGYRSEYANRCYLSKARPIDEIKKLPKTQSKGGYMVNENLYTMRTDMKGKQYDRQAMLFASRCLGHNRIDVVASHYLRDI